MKILEHFSRHKRLSIKIDDVIAHILYEGYVDRIVLHPVDEDPDVLAGMMLKRRNTAPYAIGDVADVVFSTQLPDDWQRLVCAKELLHICDVNGVCARSEAQVSQLITEMGLPASALIEIAKISRQFASDHTGLLRALGLLVPLAALDDLGDMYRGGVMNAAEISALAEVPETFMPLILHDKWPELLGKICMDEEE